MALLLARMLVKTGTYDPEAVRKEYQYWLSSDPFDCGMTISAGLLGKPNPDCPSQKPHRPDFGPIASLWEVFRTLAQQKECRIS